MILFAYHKKDVHSLFQQEGRPDVSRLDSTFQCRTAVEEEQGHPGERTQTHLSEQKLHIHNGLGSYKTEKFTKLYSFI